MYRLQNTVRDYAWGSHTLMAHYLGRSPSKTPEAELWLGAHPGAPSIAENGTTKIRLDELIAANPGHALGDRSRAAFGDKLPFLLKVLAAGSPLSLQVHPTQDQAASGYAAEEASGVPRSAPTRNYKDFNHKPEMILALTEFAALCGFRPAAQSSAVFGSIVSSFKAAGAKTPGVLDEVRCNLSGSNESAAIRTAFSRLIRGGSDVSHTVHIVAELLRERIPEGPHAVEFETALALNDAYPGDPGVLISLMLNKVTLHPGEAVFLPAGNIHAYLHGLGIEVMASSDNVLRGGLTSKHIDVEELMSTVEFKPLPVPRINASAPSRGRQVWEPPFDEFQLQRLETRPGEGIQLPAGAPAIVLAVAGAGVLSSRNTALDLLRGDSAFISADEGPAMLQAVGPEAVVAFVATIAANPASPVRSGQP
ncbi:mannose-6-phosphate isomerase, class I [Pseudarthrobacter sp. DSP2-3-2b1]|uniref:mannose-6-phosphate isomerase, class I n=1 Tax=Pseudarthrobacter sp. DSP2-3-2b1 TaxID=2804661 RepID=UPI003CEAB9F6